MGEEEEKSALNTNEETAQRISPNAGLYLEGPHGTCVSKGNQLHENNRRCAVPGGQKGAVPPNGCAQHTPLAMQTHADAGPVWLDYQNLCIIIQTWICIIIWDLPNVGSGFAVFCFSVPRPNKHMCGFSLVHKDQVSANFGVTSDPAGLTVEQRDFNVCSASFQSFSIRKRRRFTLYNVFKEGQRKKKTKFPILWK